MVSISKRVRDVLSLYLLNEMVHDVLSLSMYVKGNGKSMKCMKQGHHIDATSKQIYGIK